MNDSAVEDDSTSADGGPEEQPRKAVKRAYVLTAVLLLLFLVCDVGIATVVDARGDKEGGVVVGLIFAQIVLIATWTALGPVSLFHRAASGIVATSLVALTLVACIYNSDVDENPVFWFAILAAQCLGTQLPLWVLRLGFGWKLAWPGQRLVPLARSDSQFAIRQLMAWTALVAVTLGIGRVVLSGIDPRADMSPERSVAAFGIVTTFNCLLAWPIIWAAFTRAGWPAWVAVAFVCSVVLTYAQITTLNAEIGGGGTEFFWLVNAIQALAAGGSLVVVRLSGFRLVRTTPRRFVG